MREASFDSRTKQGDTLFEVGTAPPPHVGLCLRMEQVCTPQLRPVRSEGLVGGVEAG